jgi:hypothetical protein
MATAYTPQTTQATAFTAQTTNPTLQGESGFPVTQLYDSATDLYDDAAKTYDGITTAQLQQIQPSGTVWGAM